MVRLPCGHSQDDAADRDQNTVEIHGEIVGLFGAVFASAVFCKTQPKLRTKFIASSMRSTGWMVKPANDLSFFLGALALGTMAT